MARPLRIQYPGALYHVTNRGNERKPIFKDDTDRLKFLEILSGSIATYSTKLYSFVLMTNHFHLLVETPLANLSEFMRHFNITYTSAFNRRHKRAGHLYQGRYKSILVDRDEYLSMVSRYIHLNPAKVGSIKQKPIKEQLSYLWTYKWSSLPGCITVRNRFAFVDYEIVLEEYGGDTLSGRSRYKKQIITDLLEGLPIKEKVVGQSLLGEESFVTWVKESFIEKEKDRERPAMAEVKRFLVKDEILNALSEVSGVPVKDILSQSGPLRHIAMDLMFRRGGLTNPEIGKLMGIDYSTVSQGRKRMREKIPDNQKLQRILKSTETKLSRLKI
jgi:REP element-mobilizing transposase RayT